MRRDAMEATLAKLTDIVRDDRPGQVEKVCQTLLRQEPEATEFLERLGVLLLEAKRFKPACAVWRHLHQRNPQDYLTCLNLAKSYLYANKRDLAVRFFEHAASLGHVRDRQAPRRPVRQVSVVMATCNRGHLLARSLEGYARQALTDFELVILDDASTDDTFDLVRHWQDRLDIKYLRLAKPADCAWRDAGSVINLGLRAAFGELLVCTHPEVIPGRQSLAALFARRRDYCYLSCKNYTLTAAQPRLLDSVDWKNDLLAVRGLPEFYDDRSLGQAYSARAIERAPTAEEWVFGGLTRRTWQWIGGFRESTVWGACDLTFNLRRAVLGIPTVTPGEEATFCLHQNHDTPGVDVLSPRDVAACTREVPVYRTQDQALEGNLW